MLNEYCQKKVEREESGIYLLFDSVETFLPRFIKINQWQNEETSENTTVVQRNEGWY